MEHEQLIAVEVNSEETQHRPSWQPGRKAKAGFSIVMAGMLVLLVSLALLSAGHNSESTTVVRSDVTSDVVYLTGQPLIVKCGADNVVHAHPQYNKSWCAFHEVVTAFPNECSGKTPTKHCPPFILECGADNVVHAHPQYNKSWCAFYEVVKAFPKECSGKTPTKHCPAAKPAANRLLVDQPLIVKCGADNVVHAHPQYNKSWCAFYEVVKAFPNECSGKTPTKHCPAANQPLIVKCGDDNVVHAHPQYNKSWCAFYEVVKAFPNECSGKAPTKHCQ